MSCKIGSSFLDAYVEAFGSPAAVAATPGLMAHHRSGRHDPAPDEYFRVSTRPQFRDILAAAPTGAVDPDLDPEDVFDVLLGAVLYRTLLPAVAARRPPLDRTVDLLIRMMRQATD